MQKNTTIYFSFVVFFLIGGYLVHCMKWGCRNNRRKSPGWGILPGLDNSSIFSHTKTGKYQSGKIYDIYYYNNIYNLTYKKYSCKLPCGYKCFIIIDRKNQGRWFKVPHYTLT